MTINHTQSWWEDYNDFANACSIYQGDILTSHLHSPQKASAIRLAVTLCEEEYNRELSIALNQFRNAPTLENLAEVADGIGDTIYVLCQLARSLGIPLGKVWNEIQRSNMSKVGADGTVKRREDGKVLKPEGWTKPDIHGILMIETNREHVRHGTAGSESWTKADRLELGVAGRDPSWETVKKETKPLKSDDDYPSSSNS